MPTYTINTFCGCIELRKGCLFIGYIYLLAELVFISLGMVVLVSGGVVASKDQDAEAKHEALGLVVVSVGLVLALLFLFISTVLLIIGIHTNKPVYVKVYLIVAAIAFAFGVIATIWSIVGDASAENILKKNCVLLISGYFFVVIKSYYLKMQDSKSSTLTYDAVTFSRREREEQY